MFAKSGSASAQRHAMGLAALAVFLAIGSFAARPSATERRDALAGQLLVASEEMTDPRFVESIIYIVKHDKEGTMGLVINRPLAQGPIDDLLKGFGAEAEGSAEEIVIHYGGPVSRRQGFLLHSDDIVLENSIRVKDGIAATSDTEIIQAIATGKGPGQFLFMLGYAGWAPGQLDGEIEAKTWAIVPADKFLIFGKDAEKKWRQAIDRRRIAL
jgi:putative transcriptional regulator